MGSRLLIAEIHGLAGCGEELRQLLSELAAGARGEPGCVTFKVLQSEEPGDFTLVSHWADEAALRAHYDSPAYQRYRRGVGELLARPSDVTVHHVSESIHARDPNRRTRACSDDALLSATQAG